MRVSPSTHLPSPLPLSLSTPRLDSSLQSAASMRQYCQRRSREGSSVCSGTRMLCNSAGRDAAQFSSARPPAHRCRLSSPSRMTAFTTASQRLLVEGRRNCFSFIAGGTFDPTKERKDAPGVSTESSSTRGSLVLQALFPTPFSHYQSHSMHLGCLVSLFPFSPEDAE